MSIYFWILKDGVIAGVVLMISQRFFILKPMRSLTGYVVYGNTKTGLRFN